MTPLLLLLLILNSVVVQCQYSDDRYFKRRPENTDAIEGKPITLYCEVDPGDGAYYHWELDGSKITNTSRRYQMGSNLHITRVDRERDVGQFMCISRTIGFVAVMISPSAVLNIHWLGDVSVQLKQPSNVSDIKNGMETVVVLRCHVEGSDDIHIEWFRNADRLARNSRTEMKRNSLHLSNVQPSDNGVYRCVASNKAATRDSHMNSFVLAVPGDQTALVEIVPQDTVAREGQTVHIDCRYRGAHVTEWYFRDTGPLSSRDRIHIYPNNTIEIRNVRHEDEGRYSCVGIRSDSTEMPQSYSGELRLAHLNNLTSDSFEPSLKDDVVRVVAEGYSLELTCLKPDGYPKPKSWWVNPAGHTISDSGPVHSNFDGTLIIEPAHPSMAGNYTCVAENAAGKTQFVVPVIVTTLPVLVEQPLSVIVNESEVASFRCNYTTTLPEFTTLRWRKDGKILDKSVYNGLHPRIRLHGHTGSELRIEDVQSGDRGDYHCELLTHGFEIPAVVSKTAVLSVVETLKFAPPPVDKRLELGSMAKIHCKVQGTPTPFVRWQRQSADGNDTEMLDEHISDQNGTLVFNGVQNDDRGRYTCVANNTQGFINVTISVDVVVAPGFSVMPQNPTVVTEGQSIMIDCVVEGDPPPTIQWDKNLRMNDFDDNRFHVLSNGTLIINEVHRDDENKYGCTAGNSAGLNRKEFQLIVNGYGEDGDDDATVTKAVLITMSVAAAYIILVVGLMVWCRYRRRSRKLPISPIGGGADTTRLAENGELVGCDTSNDQELKDSSSTPLVMSNGTISTATAEATFTKPSTKSNNIATVDRSSLDDLKLVGRGEFGDILLARLNVRSVEFTDKAATDDTNNSTILVMLKALMNSNDDSTLQEFQRELDLFHKVKHENVVRLIGLCTDSELNLMILEHTDWGDLKQFLVATGTGKSDALTCAQSLAVLHQLACGMQEIARQRLILRDLAARNCLISSQLRAKISLARMSRDPYSQEYCKHLNQVVPLRWLPYEALFEDEYSVKSDSYAFGVLVNEVFSQGELPFSKISDTTFMARLRDNKFVEWKSHSSVPEPLQQIQKQCWSSNPNERPDFDAIVHEIDDIINNEVVTVTHET